MFIMSTYPALQLQLLREISFVAASKHTFSACGASFLRIDRNISPSLQRLHGVRIHLICASTLAQKNGSLAVLTFVWVFPHQNMTMTGLPARGRENFCIRLQPSFRVACQTPKKRRSLRCVVEWSITPLCTLSSCFILTSPNVSDVTDRATRSSQFCVQFTDEMHVDCNHFGHQMFLSLWSEHLIKYCSILERRKEDRGWGWGRCMGNFW